MFLRMQKQLKKRKFLFFPLYLVLGFFAFAPYISSVVSFFIFIPFFYYLFQESKLKNVVKVSIYSGFGFFLINSFWIYRFTITGIFLLALYLMLYWVLSGLFFYYFKDKKYFFFYFPLFWTILEIIRGMTRFGFSWSEIGYSVSQFLFFSNIAYIGGVHLLTYLLVLINLLIAYYFFINKKIYLKKTFIIFFISLALGITIYFVKKSKTSNDIKVSVIQPSIDLFAKWDNDFINTVMDKYYKLAMRVEKDSNLVIWPETAFVNGLLNYRVDRNTMKKILMNQKSDAKHLVGTTLYKGNKNYNSLFLIDEEGNYDYYSKKMLVPFAEFLPFEKYTKFLMDIYPIQYLLSRGENYKVFKMGNIKFSGLICFESIFPHFLHNFIKKGAKFVVVSTNDGWYIDTLAPFQHLQFARMRAIEQNRYFVQCANSGISAFIDNKGRIYKKLGENKAAIIEDKVFLIEKKSIYYFLKDYYWIFFILMSIILFLKESRIKRKE
ncbi:MAG: apolipoprotein N-acyltransferase [Candidatus Mcinerneyibacterium aminivorans]|uniref:Apolipoprotein N-acyltransferase n=1 Tax=Candidatus Mcinerneyibacterium aminivorans TaxID=2703815 RepID=A0A5D0MJD9_9BACT|nr:MAG: apolipoprotein N-acyltransferase [Candidatus Mcinerneyibacterium aminivorans]